MTHRQSCWHHIWIRMMNSTVSHFPSDTGRRCHCFAKLGSDLGDKRCFPLNIWIFLRIWKVPHRPCFEHLVTSMKCYFDGHGTFRSWVLVGRNGLLSVAFEGYTFPWFWFSFLYSVVSYQVNSSVGFSVTTTEEGNLPRLLQRHDLRCMRPWTQMNIFSLKLVLSVLIILMWRREWIISSQPL